MPIPEYALAQARAEKQASARPPAGDGEPELAQSPASREEPAPSVPPGAAFDLGAAARRAAPFVLLLSMAACKGGSVGSGVTPQAPGPAVSSSRSAGAVAGVGPVQDGSALAAAFRLQADVDALGKRVERLDPEAYAVPAGLGCAAACDVLRVKRMSFRPGVASCECGRVPQVKAYAKVYPNRANQAPAARIETVDGPDGPVAMADAGGAP